MFSSQNLITDIYKKKVKAITIIQTSIEHVKQTSSYIANELDQKQINHTMLNREYK